MGGILERIKSWWDGAEKSQRTIATVGGGFLAFLIVVTYMFASRPHMGLLAAGLSSAEQGTVVMELQKQGVAYDMDASGNISVPSDKIAELRAKLIMKGTMPATGHTGVDPDLANMSVMSTPRVEKERLKGIAEARLAENIASLDGVSSASVHLALADDSPFVSEKKAATASVIVFGKGDGSLGKEQAHGIALLVASSVPDLDPSGVTVVDGHGNVINDPGDQASPSGKVSNKLETEKLEARRREREIQSKLDAVFGAGQTLATVNLEIDFKGEKFTSDTHTPVQPVETSSTVEKMSGGGTAGGTGGASGVGTNAAAAAAAPTAVTGGPDKANSGYENKSTNTTYVMDEKHSEGEDPAGNLKSMAISVLVNSDKIKDPKPVQDWITNYLGVKATDKNFTANVVSTKFDTTAATDAAKAASAASTRDRMQQIFSLLPIVALVGVALMVIKALGKFAKGGQPLMVATGDGRTIALPSGGINVSAEGLAQNGGTLTMANGQPVATGGLPRLARGLGGEEEEGDYEVDSIKRKINVPLEQIKKMSSDRPEVVAMLIRTWLMEERR